MNFTLQSPLSNSVEFRNFKIRVIFAVLRRRREHTGEQLFQSINKHRLQNPQVDRSLVCSGGVPTETPSAIYTIAIHGEACVLFLNLIIISDLLF